MADSIYTTIPTSARRAVVTGLTAAPVMALPAGAAVPPGTSPGPDPTFPLLDAERQACAVIPLQATRRTRLMRNGYKTRLRSPITSRYP